MLNKEDSVKQEKSDKQEYTTFNKKQQLLEKTASNKKTPRKTGLLITGFVAVCLFFLVFGLGYLHLGTA
jgi:hypothetical protein